MYRKISTYRELIQVLREKAQTYPKDYELLMGAAKAIENLLQEDRTLHGMQAK